MIHSLRLSYLPYSLMETCYIYCPVILEQSWQALLHWIEDQGSWRHREAFLAAVSRRRLQVSSPTTRKLGNISAQKTNQTKKQARLKGEQHLGCTGLGVRWVTALGEIDALSAHLPLSEHSLFSTTFLPWTFIVTDTTDKEDKHVTKPCFKAKTRAYRSPSDLYWLVLIS